ncbi:MAG: helix-turn-helix domain-containing protein [Hyphomonas sp.]|nr:helix-turn-helix domain-containing protein [Hyphomonas sp.]
MAITKARGAIRRGELARRAGCNIETIRYYEKIGLLDTPARSDAGHRLYEGEDEARLNFILRGRELGFSIDELRSLLSLVDSGNHTCAEVLALTRQHLASVQDKIADLQRLEATLGAIADNCTGDRATECPVIDALWGSARSHSIV